MKRLLVTLCAVVLVSGCALTPEQKLQKGYLLTAKSVDTATVLLRRGAISSADAREVLEASNVAESVLDSSTIALTKCRALGTKDCNFTVDGVDFNSGSLLELERFLEERQAEKNTR